MLYIYIKFGEVEGGRGEERGGPINIHMMICMDYFIMISINIISIQYKYA